MNKKILIIVLIAIVLIGGIIFAAVSNFENKQEKGETSIANEEETIKEDKNEEEENNMYSSGLHHASIEIKNYGTIKLELDADIAPITVSNFAKLVNEGFYNGLTFHRIIDGFMIQGGDPLGNGMGGSDEEIKGEFKLNGVENNISHKRGVISMARATPYDSASSQFFIMHKDISDSNQARIHRLFEGKKNFSLRFINIEKFEDKFDSMFLPTLVALN